MSFEDDLGELKAVHETLANKCRAVGFTIERSRYFDLVGIVPWFIKYRILRSDSLGTGAVGAYDRIAVPLVRRLESLLPIPIGKISWPFCGERHRGHFRDELMWMQSVLWQERNLAISGILPLRRRLSALRKGETQLFLSWDALRRWATTLHFVGGHSPVRKPQQI